MKLKTLVISVASVALLASTAVVLLFCQVISQ
jgi:hypothetical protein